MLRPALFVRQMGIPIADHVLRQTRPSVSVRVERSRDTLRNGASLTGISTSLDANGFEKSSGFSPPRKGSSRAAICPPRSPPAGHARHASAPAPPVRSEEHTSELQSLMSISYAVFCLKQKKKHNKPQPHI